MSDENPRTIERTIEIDAPTDVVWKALSEAQELVRWFPLQAEIEPRVGGRYWMSWGGEYEGEHRIEILADVEIDKRAAWYPDSRHNQTNATTTSARKPAAVAMLWQSALAVARPPMSRWQVRSDSRVKATFIGEDVKSASPKALLILPRHTSTSMPTLCIRLVTLGRVKITPMEPVMVVGCARI